jgi:hypothetical protein
MVKLMLLVVVAGVVLTAQEYDVLGFPAPRGDTVAG